MVQSLGGNGGYEVIASGKETIPDETGVDIPLGIDPSEVDEHEVLHPVVGPIGELGFRHPLHYTAPYGDGAGVHYKLKIRSNEELKLGIKNETFDTLTITYQILLYPSP